MIYTLLITLIHKNVCKFKPFLQFLLDSTGATHPHGIHQTLLMKTGKFNNFDWPFWSPDQKECI